MKYAILTALFVCVLNSYSQVFEGDLTLTTQSQVDDFNYKKITGVLTLSGSNISNIDGLITLDTVSSIYITGTNIEHLGGLANLKYITGVPLGNGSFHSDMMFQSNPKLRSLAGLGNTKFFDQMLISINNCDALKNLQGIQHLDMMAATKVVSVINCDSLETLSGLNLPVTFPIDNAINTLIISNNARLTDINAISGFSVRVLDISNNSSLKKINFSSAPAWRTYGEITVTNNSRLESVRFSPVASRRITISFNPLLDTLSGMSQLSPMQSPFSFSEIMLWGNKLSVVDLFKFDAGTIPNKVDGDILISNNSELKGLSFLEHIKYCDDLLISNNPRLSSCCAIYPMLKSNGVTNQVVINNNMSPCDSEESVLGGCGVLFNQIYGYVYIDVNSNNIFDSGDSHINNIKIQVSKGGNTVTHLTANDEGCLFVTDTGKYDVRPLSDFNHFVTLPVNRDVVRNGLGYIDTVNFKIAPAAFQNDASVFLSNNWRTRPGTEGAYTISYTNESGMLYNGVIKLKLDNRLNFNRSIPSPTAIIGDTIIWNINSMEMFSSKEIIVYFHPLSTLVSNDTLDSYVNISNNTFDATPDNNTSILIDIVRSSCDPNDKNVDKTMLRPSEVSSDKYLYYTIRFQNVGNDTAFNIEITDTLDNNLDWNSFQPVNASHRYIMEQYNGKYIKFIFNNIQLPDSIENEKASHGYIIYKIRVKQGVDVGNVIQNKASIVFDFNPPILTNTTKTVIIDTKAGRDTVICQGDNITLTASGATTYQWSTGVGTPSATVSPSQTTQYIVAGIVSGVVQKDTVIVSVKPLPTINLGNDKALCSGDSIIITAATNATSLLWNTNDTAHSIIIKPTVAANYSVIANLNGCKNTDAISVFVKPLPNVAFTKTQNGAQVQFSAPGGNTSYHWSFGDTTTSTQQNPLHTYTKNGKFYVTLTAGLDGCTQTKTDSVSITITAITNQLSVVDKIHVAPNPVAQFLTLDMEAKKATDFNVTLLNINGQVVFTKIYNKTSVIHDMLDTHELSSGVYLLQIQAEGEQAVFRIIKK
jgi:uncharacterized repeat protein (TIGR01451 family)